MLSDQHDLASVDDRLDRSTILGLQRGAQIGLPLDDTNPVAQPLDIGMRRNGPRHFGGIRGSAGSRAGAGRIGFCLGFRVRFLTNLRHQVWVGTPRIPLVSRLLHFGDSGAYRFWVRHIHAQLARGFRALGRALYRRQLFTNLALMTLSNPRHVFRLAHGGLIEAEHIERRIRHAERFYGLHQVSGRGNAFTALDRLDAYGLEAFIAGGGLGDSVGGVIGEDIGTMCGKEALSAIICDGESALPDGSRNKSA